MTAFGSWTKPVIGLTGRAQHGKDSVAGFLARDWRVERVSFAAPLKELAYLVNPLIPLGDEPAVTVRLRELVDSYGWETAKQYPETRRFLQELGTRAREVLGEFVWVDRAVEVAEQRRREGYAVVFTDVRFPNEAAAVRSMGGTVVLVDRPDFDNGVDPNHPSEAQVQRLGHQYTLVNEGDLDELAYKSSQLYMAVEMALDGA